jgi:hypothetical protein
MGFDERALSSPAAWSCLTNDGLGAWERRHESIQNLAAWESIDEAPDGMSSYQQKIN